MRFQQWSSKMSMFGMTDAKKTLLIQEIYQRPLIWKVFFCRFEKLIFFKVIIRVYFKNFRTEIDGDFEKICKNEEEKR